MQEVHWGELRDLVQIAASASACQCRELRNRASWLRWRMVGMNALRQQLIGARGRECLAKGRWPTDHGHDIRSRWPGVGGSCHQDQQGLAGIC